MRDLMNSEVSSVGGGGDADCTKDDDGIWTCEGDAAYGNMGTGDYWIVGDNGSWHITPDGNGEFFPSDLDRSLN